MSVGPCGYAQEASKGWLGSSGVAKASGLRELASSNRKTARPGCRGRVCEQESLLIGIDDAEETLPELEVCAFVENGRLFAV